MRTPTFVPVLFHNLEGYDSHLFVKSLGGQIGCIPKTDEKYISFNKFIAYNNGTKNDEEIQLIRPVRAMKWTKEEIEEMADWTDEEIDRVLNLTDKEIEGLECGNLKLKQETLEVRLLDSVKFTLKSLDGLVKGLGPDQFKTLERVMGTNELLKKKGVFPYEYMTGFDKLSDKKLPSKKDFYSKLNDEHISDEQYEQAQKVWNEFGCKTMRDYHDLYLKTDVLLLADVMQNYRDVCIKNYGLDPLWYYTAPGLAWDAALKISKAKLELLTDPNMYLMVEARIRGGISTITKRYAKANNKYMNKYDCEKESFFIPYLDANNLYGWAMSQPLSVDGFKWLSTYEFSDWDLICNNDNTGCILEVDLEYPKELHDTHNEYPLAPEPLKINKVSKLIPNLHDKTKYILYTTKIYDNI